MRALDSSPGNLRPSATSFIGRDAELAEVTAALRNHRLVTLTGVGGVGKTRLAVEVATRLADEFPDGVWLFELAAVSDPAAVPDAVTRGEATRVRAADARYFAGREADILALWDSPRQRQAYDWFTVELANLRTAFRWAADNSDLDVAAAIATYAGFLGYLVENYEPIAWTEEIIEPASAGDHPRLAACM